MTIDILARCRSFRPVALEFLAVQVLRRRLRYLRSISLSIGSELNIAETQLHSAVSQEVLDELIHPGEHDVS